MSRAHRLLLPLLAALVLFSGCGKVKDVIDDKMAVRNAEKRVYFVLEGTLKGESATNNDRYRSVCQWYQGTNTLPSNDILDKASDDFDRWQRAKKIHPTITSYEITGAERVPDSDPPTVRVSVTIDGSKELQIDVARKTELSWAKKSRR